MMIDDAGKKDGLIQKKKKERKKVNAISGPDFVRQDDNPCGAPVPAWRHTAGRSAPWRRDT